VSKTGEKRVKELSFGTKVVVEQAKEEKIGEKTEVVKTNAADKKSKNFSLQSKYFYIQPRFSDNIWDI
jgi:hypothetical protein